MKNSIGRDITEVGESAYRALRCAAGLRDDWGTLALETQEAWLALARQAEALLLTLEGQPAQEVAQAVYRRYMVLAGAPAGWADLTGEQKLCWEAVARHLHTLHDLDEEDLPDLEGYEHAWRPWVERRLQSPPE